MKDLVEYVVKSLVESPDEVSIEEFDDENVLEFLSLEFLHNNVLCWYCQEFETAHALYDLNSCC